MKRSVMIFNVSVDVVDNDTITKETPQKRCKRNLSIFCHTSIFGEVTVYFTRI